MIQDVHPGSGFSIYPGFGSRIQGSKKHKSIGSRIRIQGSKAPDPGSGSATLLGSCLENNRIAGLRTGRYQHERIFDICFLNVRY
jgi:hypothetical protein